MKQNIFDRAADIKDKVSWLYLMLILWLLQSFLVMFEVVKNVMHNGVGRMLHGHPINKSMASRIYIYIIRKKSYKLIYDRW